MNDEKKVKRVRREEIQRNKRESPRYRRAYDQEFRASLWDYAHLVPCIGLVGVLVIVAILCLVAAIMNAFKGHTFGTIFLSACVVVAALAAVSIYAKVIHGEWADCRAAAHKAGLKAKSSTNGDEAEDDEEGEEEDGSPTSGGALGSDIMAACMGGNRRH